MPTLKKWYLTRSETGHIHAHGAVYGHYRFEDGDYINTSRIEFFYLDENGDYIFVTRSGSPYHLAGNQMMDELRERSLKQLAKQEIRPIGDEEKKYVILAEEAFEKRRQEN